MLNKKELLTIFLIITIIGLSSSLLAGIEFLGYALAAMAVIIIVNVLAKKIMGYYLESEIEIRLWEIKQYGFRPNQHFQKPFPLGAFLPIISKIIFFPIKGLVWMGSLVFDVKAKVYRAAKRHGLYSFSEITESHIGIIAAAGIIANLLFALIGYLIGFQEFSRLSIFYAFFNMLPLSDLDGNKIFFGNIILWSFLAAIVLIAIFFTLFIA